MDAILESLTQTTSFLPSKSIKLPTTSSSVKKRIDFDEQSEQLTSVTVAKKRRLNRTRDEDIQDIEAEDFIDTSGFDFETVQIENKPLSPIIPDIPIVKYRQVLRLIPEVPHITICTENGSRVYLRLFPQKKIEIGTSLLEKENIGVYKPKKYTGLLGIKFAELHRQAIALKDKIHHTLDDLMDKENMNLLSKKDDELLVDKYRPKSYMELLSEETLNHNLLHWLKLWDNIVFGHDYLLKYKETKEKYAKLEAQEKEKEWNKSKSVSVEDDCYDELGRPKQKVALLYGPPGLGKTTCAHVVAKQAGYNVIELNASDDRSVDIFKKVLDATTQSRSEMFQDGRPNCLIIDEIDGAPLVTVEVLVELLSGRASEKGKNKAKKILRRPVICICNDLYAPCIKNLKKMSLILQFQPVSVQCLVERIQEISFRENLTLDTTTIHALAEKSECDIRSCLSSMQFLKRRKTTSKDTLLAQLGGKDKNKGIFSVWTDVFTMPESSRKYGAGDPTKAEARFQNVLRSAQSFGDYEKLSAGIFENYLKTKFRDSYFQSILEGLDWLVWFEEIQGRIDKLQNYSMYGYLPMYCVVAHFLFATANWFKLNYPNTELQVRGNRLERTVSTHLSEMCPAVSRYLEASAAVRDVFPALSTIIQPTSIRPVPTQLWSPKERETLKRIVDIMIAYNLTYTQQRTTEGTYNFILEPDIEEIARFKNEDTSTKKQFAYAVKQLVAREIETEKLRRSEPEGITIENDVKLTKFTSQISTPTPKLESKVVTVQKEEPKVYQQRDFFGRVIVPKPEAATSGPDDKKFETSDIWFRFKEGYSNAVRKNLKVKDFL